jgi:hypothetical protein
MRQLRALYVQNLPCLRYADTSVVLDSEDKGDDNPGLRTDDGRYAEILSPQTVPFRALF